MKMIETDSVAEDTVSTESNGASMFENKAQYMPRRVHFA